MRKASGPDYSREAALGGMVAGVDEAGRGPWAGPVVAAAVVLRDKRVPRGLTDSKLLPAPRREAFYLAILERHSIGVGLASVEEIDTHNILAATMLAMKRAVEALPLRPHAALVDGNRPPALPCRVECVVEGDLKCLSIAAASVIAKVTRDRIMQQLAIEHPHYGFERNAGYGTPQHQAALHTHGPTLHHRRSFAPIRALLEPQVAVIEALSA